jgi:hypothetical protein
MVDKIDGGTELLLSPEEAVLFDAQVKAQKSADVTKAEAHYQNEPNGDEQCAFCSMFVPGFPGDLGGYCTKVQSFRGPLGLIFNDCWCKFFELDPLRAEYNKALAESGGEDTEDDD